MRRRGGDPLLSKQQSTVNNDNNDAVISSASKNNGNHNIFFFMLIVVFLAALHKGGTCPRGYPLRLMPLGISCHHAERRRGGDPSSSKLWSKTDDKDNNALVASCAIFSNLASTY
jgi:hypothetical protein